MTLGEAMRVSKEELEATLNSSAFTLDSLQGWIVIIVVLIMIRGFWMKTVRAVGWGCGVLVFFQICYGLSLTGLNDVIPLSKMFKFDLMTSVAQCFAGTKLCDILLWCDSFIIVSMSRLWDIIGDFFIKIFHVFRDGAEELDLSMSSVSAGK